MGAVTALKVLSSSNYINSVVVDSPFSNLYILILELSTKSICVPSCLIKCFFPLLSRYINNKYHFDPMINDLKTDLNNINLCSKSVLFLCAS